MKGELDAASVIELGAYWIREVLTEVRQNDLGWIPKRRLAATCINTMRWSTQRQTPGPWFFSEKICQRILSLQHQCRLSQKERHSQRSLRHIISPYSHVVYRSNAAMNNVHGQ